MCNHEEWRGIESSDGYEVSNHGRVRSLARIIVMRDGVQRPIAGRILAPKVDRRGYLRVSLGRERTALVHRLVAAAFIGPAESDMDVCHYDGNPANNDLCNLRYDTRKGNMADQKRHGTHAKRRRTHCPRGHRLAAFNLRSDAARNGLRKCRACNHALKAASAGRILDCEVQVAADAAFDQYRTHGAIVARRSQKQHVR